MGVEPRLNAADTRAVKGKLLALLAVAFVLSVPALALAADAPTPADAACKAEYLQLGADAFKAKYGATEAYGNCLRAHGATTSSPSTTTTAPSTQPPAPSGPLAACIAEYKQIGADAFKAKYGATEPYGNCLKAQGGTPPPGPPTTATTPSTNGPEAACKAEYVQLGADAFKAKYGSTSASLACIKAHGGTTQNSGDKQPKTADTKARAATYLAQALCSAEGQSLGRDAFQAKYGKGKDGLAACVSAAQTKAQSILNACKSTTSGDAFKQCVQASLKTARAR